MLRDLGILVLRVTVGGLLSGHGAQKLFGSFGGYGLQGTGGFLESLGLKPGKLWAVAAGLSEFGGGVLTTLGLFHPLGPISTLGAMGMATATVHWGKPIWAGEGGAELAVTNMAAALALALAEPGVFSIDRALGIRIPGVLVALTTFGVAAGITLGLLTRPAPTPKQQEQAATKLEAGH